MSAKNTSPEAAQRKVWKAEIKQLEANRRKVAKDFSDERKKAQAAVIMARKSLNAANASAARLHARHLKLEPRAVKAIASRIAVLKGRLGL
jgi:hypothetical protein